MHSAPVAGRSVAFVFFVVLVPVLIVLIVILVPVVLALPPLPLLFLLVLFLVRTRPAFRLIDLVEIEFLPGVEIDLLDVAIEILDLNQFGILIDRQYAEAFVFVDVLVPLARDGLVFSGHRLQSSGLLKCSIFGGTPR